MCWGRRCRPGWLAGLVKEAAAGLNGFMNDVADGLAQSDVLHLDETGGRISGVRYWFHVASNDVLTYLFCHPKRGGDAIVDAGILTRFAGTAVHDCWKPYLAYDSFGHQLCCAHLVRELAAAAEDPKHQAWAAEMIELLLDAKTYADDARAAGKTRLSRYRSAKINDRYDKIIARALISARQPGAKSQRVVYE
jgi:transposase